MPSVPAGTVTVLCRWWDEGGSGTVFLGHLPSLQEPVGMLAVVPRLPSCPKSPFPSLEGSTALGEWLNLAVRSCNEIKVSIFKECFIHYVLEMYRKWSRN